MTLYAESSTVLAWLLGEPRGVAMAEILRTADVVVTSELTLVECDRALLRSVALGRLTRPGAEDRRGRLTVESALWNVLAITAQVIDRAREPFPDDAIRALDAIHLASALQARAVVGELDLLSLDRRFRANGAALGFRVLPA